MQSIFLAAKRVRSSVRTISKFVACVVIATAIKPATCAARDKYKDKAQRLIRAAASAEVSGDHAVLDRCCRTQSKPRPTVNSPIGNSAKCKSTANGLLPTMRNARRQQTHWQREYQQRRRAASKSLQDQLTLARWCRDNKLNDGESQLHWAVVLSLEPTNKEALKAVDMVWKNGRLISRNETPQQRHRAQEARDAAKHSGADNREMAACRFRPVRYSRPRCRD